MSQLEIRNLHVSIEGKEILKGLDLTVEQIHCTRMRRAGMWSCSQYTY
jgi:Fe-S cluster assembly ATPase SufC